ncbi:MAG TPA: hypothetical protein QGI71_00830 [Dehalococcoidia bacterium]|jgi:hypothetical protein|nr:hypothetical protein [Dehalococcoidia bacterium]
MADPTLTTGSGTPDTASTDDRPERLLVAARLAASEDEDGRYVFVRWEDWPHPAMLSLAPPGANEQLSEAVAGLLARLNVRSAEPRIASERMPVRMAHPRFGGEGLGWLRPLAVTVEGEPEPDAMLAGVELLSYNRALEELPTEVERAVLRAADALLAQR